jgi:hypothetical protein
MGSPDDLFADLIPGGSSAPPAPVYGAPAKPKEPTLPSGFEPDPKPTWSGEADCWRAGRSSGE